MKVELSIDNPETIGLILSGKIYNRGWRLAAVKTNKNEREFCCIWRNDVM